MYACTVVTALYKVSSKFSIEYYLEWAKHFFMLDCPIVVFTTEEIANILQSIRGKKPLECILCPFEDLYMWKMYQNEWKEHHGLDREQFHHSPELYCIWAQKSVFVEEATKRNPFETKYFYWCDIGAFRTSPSDVMCREFPIVSRFPKGKILLSSVSDATEDDFETKDGIIGDFFYKDRIVGGLWGGETSACVKWRYAYEESLIQYFLRKRFAGKDQSVMLSAYFHNPSFAEIVKPTTTDIDIWFFAQHLLSDKSIPYEIDASYMTTKEKGPIVTVSIMGGLGNQMFQIASAYAHAKYHGGILQLLRTKKEPDGRGMYWNSVLFRWQHCIVDSIPNALPTWSEANSTQYIALPPLQNDGLYMKGYFQSSKYFRNNQIKQEIRQLMRPEPAILQSVKKKYDFLFEAKDRVVVVHARRTDYLKSDWNIAFHGPLSIEYYTKATELLSKKIDKPIFLLCSDDSEYWYQTLPKIKVLQDNQIHILDEDEIHTLALLQQFSHFILANSTFSWWSAWLADAKYVLAPKKWFGPSGPNYYEDIYEDGWERI